MNTISRHSRGSAFITTLWVLIAVSGVVLVLSRSMRVEAIASANRLSQAQAEATERGAEQFLCSVVDAEVATPGSTTTVSMEAKQIGDGYFWVMKPDPDNENNRAYGLTDEAGKLDLNTAPLAMLNLLPNMTGDVASSIYNWRGTATSGDGLGATDADYEALKPESYEAKHAILETTEELLLIKGVTTDLLFGLDKNRDGVVDDTELKAGGTAATITVGGDNTSNRGIFPYVTAYGVKATTGATVTTTQKVNINTAGANQLRNVLQKGISGGRLTTIINVTTGAGTGTRNRPPVHPIFTSVLSWASNPLINLTSAELSPIFTSLSATIPGRAATSTALINVNTAPKQVLICLPGFEDSDIQAIVSHRQANTNADPSDLSWMLDAIPKNKLTVVGRYFTGRSTVFSGDIVGVSPDGRAFRRYRVVIDGSKTPAYIVYRRELTGSGWPLTADIRTAMRAGKAPPDAGATVSQSNSLLGKGT